MTNATDPSGLEFYIVTPNGTKWGKDAEDFFFQELSQTLEQ